MKKVKWQMKENFVFTPAIGLPTAAEEVKVTPQFTLEKVEDRPKLTGIYHLAVNVKVDTDKGMEPNEQDLVLIDDLDLQGNLGYFEYAVPFNIDFPPEANDPITIQTLDPHHEIDSNGVLSVIWDVECAYKEVYLTNPSGTASESEQTQQASTEETDAVAKQDVESEKTNKKLQAKKCKKKKEAAAAENEAAEQTADANEKSTAPQSATAAVDNAEADAVAKQEVGTEKTNKKLQTKNRKKEKEAAVVENEAAEQTAEADENSTAPQSATATAAVDNAKADAKQSSNQLAQADAAEVHEDKKLANSNVVVETASFSEGDEVLSFLSELEDGVSTTGFKLNDVFVQAKS